MYFVNTTSMLWQLNSREMQVYEKVANKVAFSLTFPLAHTHTQMENYTHNHNAADKLKCYLGDVGVFQGEYLIL